MKTTSSSTLPTGYKPAPAEYFSGEAFVKTLVAADEQTNCSVSDVRFEPGVRNNRFGGPMAYPPQ